MLLSKGENRRKKKNIIQTENLQMILKTITLLLSIYIYLFAIAKDRSVPEQVWKKCIEIKKNKKPKKKRKDIWKIFVLVKMPYLYSWCVES